MALTIYRCFATSGAEKEDFDCKKIQNGCKKVPTTTNMGLKGYQHEPKDLQTHRLRIRVEKVKGKEVNFSSFWKPF